MSFLLQKIAINFSLVVFRLPVLHQQFFSFMIEHANKLQHFIIDSITSIHKIKFLYQFYIHAHLWSLYIKLLILYIAEIVTLIFKYCVIAANSVISTSWLFKTTFSYGLSLLPKFQIYMITPSISLSIIYFYIKHII